MAIRHLGIVAVATALFATGCENPTEGEASPPVSQEQLAQARNLARQLLATDSLPGLSAAVAIDGEIVWAEGFGWADAEQRQPVTTDTRFRIGSASKPFTAAAAGILSERGQLDLDAPVRQYVPEFPEKRWPLTTRQLLGHTAGIRHYRGEQEVLALPRCTGVREGLALFARDSLLFEPGTKYAYSTYGYTLASAAIEAAAGMPFAEFLRREVLAPLGMDDTMPERRGGPVPNQATFYVRTANGLAVAPEADASCTLAGGGYLSTPSDLVHFGSGLLSGELLAPETLAMLWTPLRLETGQSTGYGLGWNVEQVPTGAGSDPLRMVGHGGRAVGGTTSFMVFPDENVVVAVTTNVLDLRRPDAMTTRLAVQLAQVFSSR